MQYSTLQHITFYLISVNHFTGTKSLHHTVVVSMGGEAPNTMLRVQLQETATLDLYYQENTSVHEEDELAAILLTQWKDYDQAGVREDMAQPREA